jgi:CAAX amino terminal protease family.
MNIFYNILTHNIYKIIELILLSSIIPYIVLVLKLFNLIIPVLLLVCVYCIIIYCVENKNFSSEFQKIFNININILIRIIIRWIFASLILLIITFYFFNEKFFIIQNNKPEILWKIMILYPIFSALPQEFIFCKFFFYRYKSIFKSNNNLVISSALFFAITHILFLNFIAPILSFIGGLLFANTYNKHRSLLLVSIEHGLYGNTLFFIGLGWYFWGGSINY